MNKEKFLRQFNLNFFPSNIEIDSRKVKKDALFIAIKGKFVDGHSFIDKAIQNGAKIIVGENIQKNTIKKGIQFIKVKNSLEFLNKISYAYYYEPIKKDLDIIGITGTNGKTSTTYFLSSIFNQMDINNSVIGTIQYKIGEKIYNAPNTTPFANELYKLFKLSYEDNIKYIIMEISSHALVENRVYGLELSAGAITNITQDHMDFHKTLSNYIEAKSMIINHLKDEHYLIVNNECKNTKKLLSRHPYKNIYTIGKGGNYNIHKMVLYIDHAEYDFSFEGNIYHAYINIPGIFSIYNSLFAIALAREIGININDSINAIKKIKSIPGRFEVIYNKDFTVIVDYAHTPDALQNLLYSIEKLPHNRIITIFGAGGDRDREKRPIMGEVVSKLSDLTIITSDNPRTENPGQIIIDILKGITKNKDIIVEENRESAILTGIKLAKKGDIIVIAGKGHEDYQIIGNKKIHFSDQEVVRKFLNE